jgi:hypothetical protein
MDQHDFDAMFPTRQPFSTGDAKRLDAHHRPLASLAFALCGRDPAEIERKRLAPPSELLAGIVIDRSAAGPSTDADGRTFRLEDFRAFLRQWSELASVDASDPRYKWLPRWAAPVVTIGHQSFNLWQARYEIVRRASVYLEEQ